MDKRDALRNYFGHEDFRPGQEALVDAMLAGRDAMGVMPTGAGKSVCYQIPALLLPGITLIISPLISLMIDQVMALKEMGVPAAYINSALTQGQTQKVIERAFHGQYKLIYVAPERLDAENFVAFAREAQISMVTVDEAHCISHWGQDFRPSYLRIAEFIKRLPRRPVVSAFTATATKRVRDDIVRQLELDRPIEILNGFDRPNLYFGVRKVKHKYTALLDVLEDREYLSGIVYCSTRKTVDEVCDKLSRAGYQAARYHAGLSSEERQRSQDDFQYDRVRIMVATNAFGMGIDKSNVSYVIHYNMPKDIESYYQEAGRAGRDGEAADCIMLYNGQDVMTNRWLIDHGDENPELSDAERAEQKRMDHERLKQMTFFATSKRCLRDRLLRYFGEPGIADCGNCSVCKGEPFEYAQAAPVREKKVKPGSAPRQASSGDPALYQELAALRKRIADQKGIPAYMVFSNASLDDMAGKKPTTMERFLTISGVGKAKAELYGTVFTALIREHVGAGPEIRAAEPVITQEPPAPREQKPPKRERNSAQQQSPLYAALSELRRSIARDKGIEPYMVFSNKALEDMADKRPVDHRAFLEVFGVGPTKAEQYGQPFIQLIREHGGGEPSAQQWPEPPPIEAWPEPPVTQMWPEPPPPEAWPGVMMQEEPPQTENREEPPRPAGAQPPSEGDGAAWTADEDRRLRSAYFQGASIDELARSHRRPAEEIRARLFALKLIV